MNKQEFKERTGYDVPDSLYTEIEQMYLNAGNMDKDSFCKDYKKHSESLLLSTFYQKSEKQAIKIQELTNEREEMVNFLLERAQEFGDTKLLEKAISLVGHATIIRRKIELNLPLWNLDKEYISENIR